MIQSKTYNQVLTTYRRYDPTQTIVLRESFSRDMSCRFNELVSVVKHAIDDQDCFGLKNMQVNQMQLPGEGAFNYPRSEVKMAQFMKWLQEQIDNGILEVRDLQQVGSSVEGAWTNKYIFDSYKRGVIRARMELRKFGANVPSIDDTGGILVSMSTPFHLERLGLLYTRAFSELKGVTTVMDTQISRVLAQGLADGDNPRLLVRKLVAVIDGSGVGDLGITDTLGRYIPAKRRAEMIARTEIIRAHHKATIQEYRNWGVLGIMVKGEWCTAGDDRVCTDCAELEGHVFTLDEIENMIPAHPDCRCVALPYILKEGSKYDKAA